MKFCMVIASHWVLVPVWNLDALKTFSAISLLMQGIGTCCSKCYLWWASAFLAVFYLKCIGFRNCYNGHAARTLMFCGPTLYLTSLKVMSPKSFMDSRKFFCFGRMEKFYQSVLLTVSAICTQEWLVLRNNLRWRFILDLVLGPTLKSRFTCVLVFTISNCCSLEYSFLNSFFRLYAIIILLVITWCLSSWHEQITTFNISLVVRGTVSENNTGLNVSWWKLFAVIYVRLLLLIPYAYWGWWLSCIL